MTGYFDDSHDHGMFVVAGYVAPAETWERFSRAWWQVLDDAPYPLTEFKAGDCRHRTREFSDWSKKETTALTKNLVSLIVDPEMDGMLGVGEGIFVPRTEGSIRSAFQRLSYTACCTKVIGHALLQTPHIADFSDVELLFDEQGKLEHLAQDAAATAERLFGDEHEGSVREPKFRKSHEFAGLQAADLLAHETLKEVRNRIEGREVSTALKRLTRGRPHIGQYLNLAEVLKEEDVGEPLPEYDSGARLGVMYDASGVSANRGRRLDNPDA